MLSELTPLVDLRNTCVLSVPDQGARPICVAVAMTGAHEIVRAAGSLLPPDRLAPDALWTHAWERGLAGPNGTYLFAIGDALQSNGQPEHSKWPLDVAATGASVVPHDVGRPPSMRAIFTELPLDQALLVSELLQGRHVVLLVHVTQQIQIADTATAREE